MHTSQTYVSTILNNPFVVDLTEYGILSSSRTFSIDVGTALIEGFNGSSWATIGNVVPATPVTDTFPYTKVRASGSGRVTMVQQTGSSVGSSGSDPQTSTNTGAISSNSSSISTNSADVSTLQGDILAQNILNLAQSATDSTQTADILQNMTDALANGLVVQAMQLDIAALQANDTIQDAALAAHDITNAGQDSSIQTNVTDISNLVTADALQDLLINGNSNDISNNTSDITSLQPAFPAYRQIFQQRPVFTASGTTTQTHSSPVFAIPAAGEYEITLSYRFSSDNAGDEPILRLRAVGLGLDVQGGDEFFYKRMATQSAGGLPRLTTSPSLGTDQEKPITFQQQFTLPSGNLTLDFLTQMGSTTVAYGIWDYYLKIERMA